MGSCVQERKALVARYNALHAMVGSSEALLRDMTQSLECMSLTAGATSTATTSSSSSSGSSSTGPQQTQQQKQRPPAGRADAEHATDTTPMPPAEAASPTDSQGSACTAWGSMASAGEIQTRAAPSTAAMAAGAASARAVADMFAAAAAAAAEAAVNLDVDAAVVLQLKALLNVGMEKLVPLVEAADAPEPGGARTMCACGVLQAVCAARLCLTSALGSDKRLCAVRPYMLCTGRQRGAEGGLLKLGMKRLMC